MKNESRISGLRKDIPLEYLLLALFVSFPRKVSVITADTRVLHSAFFNLRNKSPLFEDIPFEKEYFPYSIFLDYALDNLEMAEMIRKFNPSLDKFQLNRDAMSKFYEKEVKKILEKAGIEKREIKRTSKKLLEYIRRESQQCVSEVA